MGSTGPTGFQSRTTARTAWLALWTAAWAATLALARFGPERLWDTPAASWLAVALNVAAGAGWVVATTRYVRSLDELQRKVMLDALAVTLGVGWVVGFAVLVVDMADLARADVAVLPVAMGLVFVASVGVGHLRYR